MMNHSTIQLSDFVAHLVFKNTQIRPILQSGSVSSVQFGDDHPMTGNRKRHNANCANSQNNTKQNHTTKTDPTTTSLT
jgi:hypothetical protein